MRPLLDSLRFGWPVRLLLIAAGCVPLALLATAARLEPSPSGQGTHRQLGLPPCTMIQLWGLPCPSCGMTTSWAHLTRGQVGQAVEANAGGALLALLAATAGPWLLLSGVVGRWILPPPSDWTLLVIGLTVIVVTLVDWSRRL